MVCPLDRGDWRTLLDTMPQRFLTLEVVSYVSPMPETVFTWMSLPRYWYGDRPLLNVVVHQDVVHICPVLGPRGDPAPRLAEELVPSRHAQRVANSRVCGFEDRPPKLCPATWGFRSSSIVR